MLKISRERKQKGDAMIRKFLYGPERGVVMAATAIEYGLIAALISVAIIGATTATLTPVERPPTVKISK